MQRLFYYLYFPFIWLMRILYRFIKTESMMTFALFVIFAPLMISILGDFIQLPLYLKTFATCYISLAMYTPFHYFDSDVRRRRTKPGYVPLNER
ncbi:hypothetical protein EVJ24_12445 [Exiguobacterium sp. SH1S21]|uniref:hypothetical protein n=1 Tax=Exiguobacterium sp. SH1S21 TaxID=2510953 RepID=UPI00103CAF04|nr:hypothetical protein [Exiguobacterium sp. SH1S21]TCI51935.1 hypothetical protein EVJ24_12445 [Exiguobacterium sp. SH1S21]